MRFVVDLSPPETEGMSRAHTVSNYFAYIGFLLGGVAALLLTGPMQTAGIAISFTLFMVALPLWTYAETRDE